jgi:hypothetical protein
MWLRVRACAHGTKPREDSARGDEGARGRLLLLWESSIISDFAGYQKPTLYGGARERRLITADRKGAAQPTHTCCVKFIDSSADCGEGRCVSPMRSGGSCWHGGLWHGTQEAARTASISSSLPGFRPRPLFSGQRSEKNVK